MGTKIFHLAWRNLGRNRRRTVITGVALAVGMSLCVATYGLMDGMNADILRSLTRLDLGHVQAHHPDFPRKRTLKLTLPDPERILQRAGSLEGVQGTSARVYGYGLASHKTKSAGVQLVGVDPEKEPRVTEMHEQLVQGRYLDTQPTPWPRGRELSTDEKRRDDQLTRQAEQAVLAEIEQLGSEDEKEPASGRKMDGEARQWTRKLADQIAPPPARPPGIFIGTNLAKILKARLGDRVYVMTQTVDGLTAEVFFTIRGIYRTGTDTYDRTRIYMHIHDLQRFLRLDGRVHEVTLTATSVRRAKVLARRLAAAVGDRKHVLVQAWDQIRPDIQNMIKLNEVSTALMVFIIFIVAALGVVNTMLMAVFERTRELGMLKAIGMSGARILWLVLVETTLLVLAASFVGVGLGLLLDLYMMVYGFDLSSITGGISIGGMGISPVIHGVITIPGIVVPLVSLSLMSFIGAFYPAIRAARMRPAHGMREV
jgi:ABC-type lipoprotein release transport system permease subunit